MSADLICTNLQMPLPLVAHTQGEKTLAASKTTNYRYDDGGRAEAGFKGDARDCVTRAIAIATGRPYQDVYAEINAAAVSERLGTRKRRKSSARTGVHKPTIRKYLESLGWKWTPTMQIGSGCRVHLRSDELPQGRLIVKVSKHLTAVIDGVIHDTHDPSRDGLRCVYGYWSPPEISAARRRTGK